MTQPLILPPDVQAALDAYLTARVDDATWTAYVDSLGPGVALDVATDLCLWTTADTDARDWIQCDFVSDPADWDDPHVPEPPRGLTAIRTLQAFLDAEPTAGSYSVTLQRRLHAPSDLWNVTYTVRLAYPDWDSEGCYRMEESFALREATHAALAAGEPCPRVDPWAVAACRAACHAWSPAWARAQAADEDRA